MRKPWSILLILMMVAALVGCGGKQQATSTKEQPKEEQKEKQPPQESIESFSKKPVSFVVPYAAGGGTDIIARTLATMVSKDLGSLAVSNVAGGSAIPGMTQVAQAKPDGHTILMVASEISLFSHLGLTSLSYKDFKPIAELNFDPSALTVSADAPYNTIQELVEYAKKNPGKIKVGGTGKGGIWHLGAASIEKATGVQFNYVPFDGAAPAVTALLGGHIEAITVSPAEVLPHVKSGKLKTLGVLSDQRSSVLTDVPTFKDVGINATPIGVWRGILVPKDTPNDIVKILEKAFMKGAEDPDFKSFMEKNGFGLSVRNSEEFGKLMKEDYEASGILLKELGIAK